ncbi:hypothetical protein RY280_09630 [Bacillus paralicheniformis]
MQSKFMKRIDTIDDTLYAESFLLSTSGQADPQPSDRPNKRHLFSAST